MIPYVEFEIIFGFDILFTILWLCSSRNHGMSTLCNKVLFCRLFTRPEQMQHIIMGWIQNVSLLVNNASRVKFPLFICVLFLKNSILIILHSLLITAGAFVGKGFLGFHKNRLYYHGKSNNGTKVRPNNYQLMVTLREITPEEEGEIARQRANNFLYITKRLRLTKKENKFVPHQLIRNRKGKVGSSQPSGMASWARFLPMLKHSERVLRHIRDLLLCLLEFNKTVL